MPIAKNIARRVWSLGEKKKAIGRAIAGPPHEVAAGVEDYLGRTRARHLTLFMEVAMDPAAIEVSIRRFAGEVAPLIRARRLSMPAEAGR